MIKRIITAIIGISILTCIFIFSNTIVFPISFCILTLIGVYEMLGCIGLRNNIIISAIMYIMTICSVVYTQLLSSRAVFVSLFASFLFIVLYISFTLSVFSKGKVPIDKVCIAFTTCGFVIAGFISMILIRQTRYGKYIFLLCFLIPWVSDTFAYFGGMLFGKHKLIPSVSPKKTIEGSISGIVFATIITFFYGFVLEKVYEKTFPLIAFAVLGFIIAIASQIGDLIFSLIKRKYEIKDFGFIFPGHGGLLDRFDSVIAVSPILLIMCLLLEIIVRQFNI